MRLFRSSNPVIRGATRQTTYASDTPVTYSNVAIKSLYLIALVFISAYLTITYAAALPLNTMIGLLIGSFILGLISVIVGTKSVRLSHIFASIYALCEGVVLAVISAIYTIAVDDMIVPTALLTTAIVFVIMLILYTTRVIKVTHKFASILVVALISVIIMSILSIVLPFVGELFYI
ncbi:MAG: Bax inhibitor-1/YccA family protein, partial [Tenericutes bacterium]|nr:Bax inhibitor-1/YccA family protein [Mycoplasmatota bacterium]